MAIPLTGYLNRSGRYEGMDISKTCIDWCRENITPKHCSYGFQLMEPVHYGAWCGRQTWLSGQDIVLATKH